MLKQIQKIKNLGVFKDYNCPTAMEDFATKNIIYGWNYSGKTTFSRLFGLLESKKETNFGDLKFTFSDTAGDINEKNYTASTKVVRVFNSDFIWNNISFAGNAINPILLLGEDSKDAEKKIECLEKRLHSYQSSVRKTEHALTKLLRATAGLKTEESALIKKRIRLVPAFGATQLDGYITTIRQVGEHALSEEELDNALAIAHRADTDILPHIAKVTVDLDLLELHKSTESLLQKKPEFSNTMQYLVENEGVAEWIETGLKLHENKDSCEFCGNEIKASRLNDLHAHFSKDLVAHKLELNTLLQQIENACVADVIKRESEFNPQFIKRLRKVSVELNSSISVYNAELDKLSNKVKKKIRSPFITQQLQTDVIEYQSTLESNILNFNKLIEENNATSKNFVQEKNKEIERLKKHFAKEFIERVNLDRLEMRINSLKMRKKKLLEFNNPIEEEITKQKAIISLAQKGRVEINKRIASLLGSDTIQIDVVMDDDDVERFQLLRGSDPAINLSEGEKTAIAFAYFLTKLKELNNLSEAIVYIDDPISSLDSNHIFQVASIIKTTFFYQENYGNGPWLTRCKQIFFSTHNFEFFSLLRKLPMFKKTRFYMIKRLSTTESTLIDLPDSILKYSSEYHYLFNVLYDFNNSPDKTSLDVLLSLPNSIRRFVELYTYARYPDYDDVSVDRRADRIFGEEASKRILKVLHAFSHSNNIERIATNSDLISDIDGAVKELMMFLEKDSMHFEALKKSVSSD
ncbi:MAG: AAA family ATPase [Pseudomonadota bacterium]